MTDHLVRNVTTSVNVDVLVIPSVSSEEDLVRTKGERYIREESSVANASNPLTVALYNNQKVLCSVLG